LPDLAVLLMAELRTKAFDLIVDLTKQVITLSTALIALGVTFVKDFASTAPEDAQMWLALSWVAFLLSVVFGLLTLMACAGIIGRARDADSADPYKGNARAMGGLQLISFLVGLAMSIAAGFASV
jgi:hypothetical protein